MDQLERKINRKHYDFKLSSIHMADYQFVHPQFTLNGFRLPKPIYPVWRMPTSKKVTNTNNKLACFCCIGLTNPIPLL